MIKNIVFDVGNVLVRWNPQEITRRSFPEVSDFQVLVQQLFKSEIWYDLNCGKLTVTEALQRYHTELGITRAVLQTMMQNLRESLVLIEDSIKLLKYLHRGGWPLYALTDNVREIVAELQARYDFWPLFQGVVVSAEVGVLKPDAAIYQHLLQTYRLKPEETLFIDDHWPNIQGAREVGMAALQFQNPGQCIEALAEFGIHIPAQELQNLA